MILTNKRALLLLAGMIGMAVMWPSFFTGSRSLEAEDHVLSLAFLAVRWSGRLCELESPTLARGIVLAISAAWMVTCAAVALKLVAKTGRPSLGVLVIVVALLFLIPLWPTRYGVCPTI